jgi:hypothetical protein
LSLGQHVFLRLHSVNGLQLLLLALLHLSVLLAVLHYILYGVFQNIIAARIIVHSCIDSMQ